MITELFLTVHTKFGYHNRISTWILPKSLGPRIGPLLRCYWENWDSISDSKKQTICQRAWEIRTNCIVCFTGNITLDSNLLNLTNQKSSRNLDSWKVPYFMNEIDQSNKYKGKIDIIENGNKEYLWHYLCICSSSAAVQKSCFFASK